MPGQTRTIVEESWLTRDLNWLAAVLDAFPTQSCILFK